MLGNPNSGEILRGDNPKRDSVGGGRLDVRSTCKYVFSSSILLGWLGVTLACLYKWVKLKQGSREEHRPGPDQFVREDDGESSSSRATYMPPGRCGGRAYRRGGYASHADISMPPEIINSRSPLDWGRAMWSPHTPSPVAFIC